MLLLLPMLFVLRRAHMSPGSRLLLGGQVPPAVKCTAARKQLLITSFLLFFCGKKEM